KCPNVVERNCQDSASTCCPDCRAEEVKDLCSPHTPCAASGTRSVPPTNNAVSPKPAASPVAGFFLVRASPCKKQRAGLESAPVVQGGRNGWPRNTEHRKSRDSCRACSPPGWPASASAPGWSSPFPFW